jgi:hypothetical protein
VSDTQFQLGASIDVGFDDSDPGGLMSACPSGFASSAGGFLAGLGEGAWDGITGMVQGIVQLGQDGYQLATSSQYRQQTWQSATKVGQTIGSYLLSAATNPSKAANEAGNAAAGAWQSLKASYDQAAAQGKGSEFVGKLVGQGAVVVGTAFIPGGAEAEAVGGVADVGRVAELASDAGKAVELSGDASKVAEVAEVAGSGTGSAASDYGVAFFGQDNLKYYNAQGATLGAKGRSFFLMPLEDSGVVNDAASAARYSGMSPSTLKAYISDSDVYGISFPTDGMTLAPPTTADAMGWPHFLEGGHTAVLGEGANAGYLVNPTRELVTPGGAAVPTGSVLFKLAPDGSWLPMKAF